MFRAASSWYERQTKTGKIAFLIAMIVTVALVLGVAVHFITRNNLDEKVSEHFGYKVTGCHIVSNTVPDDNVGACNEGVVFDYDAETGEVSN